MQAITVRFAELTADPLVRGRPHMTIGPELPVGNQP
jgi:hypothetical protein